MANDYPKFTLLNLLLAMTIIAMGFGLWLIGQQAKSLKKQTDPLKQLISKLEYELGYPNVSDPSRMHVDCKFRMSGSSRYFQYRVYVPEDCQGKIDLTLKGDADLQRRGLDKHYSFEIASGKHTIEFESARAVSGDAWEYDLTSPKNGGYSFSGPMPPWFESGGAALGIKRYAPPPEGIEAGGSFDLLRKKTKREDDSTIELVLEISLSAPTAGKGPAPSNEDANAGQ